jgi:hypothetical protein
VKKRVWGSELQKKEERDGRYLHIGAGFESNK